MTSELGELVAIKRLTGLSAVALERCAWGFENRTDVVTLHDGRQVVVQRIARRPLAALRVRLATQLPERFAAVGLRLPQVIAANPAADPPFVIREHLPGKPANLLLHDTSHAALLGAAMGALLPQLARVDPGGLPLPDTWADPVRLGGQAGAWLAAHAAQLSPRARAALDEAIGGLRASFAGRPVVFAHGDFCPVNALTAPVDDAMPAPIVALLDVEYARLADPLFDASWWSWVVRFHHPQQWAAAWPALRAAARLPDDAPTSARIRTLQLLRLLEHLELARFFDPPAAPHWAHRLDTTAAWD